jgi:hypothetical protein
MIARDFDPDLVNDEAEAYIKSWMGDQIEIFKNKCKL